MIPKGHAIVTETHVTITFAPAGSVDVLDLWDDAPIDLTGITAFQVEPRRWWLIDADDAALAGIAGRGAIAPIGGGLTRAALRGARWRAALMEGGCFDAENPAFAPGHAAATILHHVPVWIHVTAPDAACVYFAASYTGAMADAWGVATP